MLAFYIFALLIHAAFSVTPCQEGVKIVSQKTNNPEDLIGNWTYVYHWDNLNQFKQEFVNENVDRLLYCPEISISAVTPEYVKAKEVECGNFQAPFSWSDAKLRLDAPLMKMKGGIVFYGQRDNWMMLDCGKMVRVVMKKVSDYYTVMINPDVAHISEMIARRAPTLEELKCVAHNVDVGKGMSGFGLCY